VIILLHYGPSSFVCFIPLIVAGNFWRVKL